MGSYYKKQLNDFVSAQNVKAKRLYDIGGAQHPIKGRTASWDVEDYRIIDLAVPHVEIQHPDIEHDMNKTWVGMEQADVIYCLGVSDYIINPNIFMDNIQKMMTDDGFAWVEFPFVYPIHNPVDDEGCRYSEGCIRRLAKQAGLKIQEIIYKRPLPGNRLLLDFYSADGMRAARGVDHNVTGYIVRMTHGS